MQAALQQLRISLALHYRNKMALIYGYLFPLIFLLAFWVLYRYESVPLIRHMGELLTVSVLGGACFGLPTTMVSERERGIWRRYRLAPVSTSMLVSSTVTARYLIRITAGLLQLAAALAAGMPLPGHPAALFAAFAFVSFAFIGLGLVMAMMADNVPAVQALGQCIFLPMLIIGGIAVPLASLPDWAQHLSQFFPGRYAVEALQACIVGPGLSATGFELLALLIIGIGGAVAGAKMFRWDAQQRFARRSGKAWISVALISWIVVGTLAEFRARASAEAKNSSQSVQMNLPAPPPESTTPSPQPSSPPTSPIPSDVILSAAERKAAASRAPEMKAATPPSSAAPSSPPATKPSAPAPRAEKTPAEGAPPPHPAAKSWQAV